MTLPQLLTDLPETLGACEDGACDLPSSFDAAEEAHEALQRAGWTDGLPVRLLVCPRF